MPKLSIITVNLNDAQGLKRTLESVVCQTFNDFEYIVIDGGSTDGSVDVIKEFAHRISYWVSEPDKGIYNAMNKGILKSTGEYLLFLNSGDWLVDCNVVRNVFNKSTSADILYGDIFLWYSENKIKLWSFKNKTIDVMFFYSSSLAHPATFIKRKLFTNELYDESLIVVSDWKFFIQKIIFDDSTIFYLDFPVSYFNKYGTSSEKNMHVKLLNERYQVLKCYLPKKVLANIEELYELSNYEPVKHVLEINKNKVVSFVVFLFLKSLCKLLKKLGLIK